MKALTIVLLCLVSSAGFAQEQQRPRSAMSIDKGNFVVTERGPNHRRITQIVTETHGNQSVVTRTNTYVELETGMHFLQDGVWVESNPKLSAHPDGAIGTNTAHQVILAGNINTAGAVDVLTSDGRRLVSHILGIGYVDANTGNSILIAEIKDSQGQFLSDNAVIYPDAFAGAGFRADVRYVYTKAGLEQDVILVEQIPSPIEYGLDPATTRLAVFTEFVESPPPRVVERDRGELRGSVDEVLDFGAMKIGWGRAFNLQTKGKAISVDKKWEAIEGRRILFEELNYRQVKPWIDKLPVPQAAGAKRGAIKERTALKLPTLGKRKGKPISKRYESDDKGGVLIDYVLSGSLTNHTFRGDTTYVITNRVDTYGTTIFEGNTVIKYRAGAILAVNEGVECKTDDYRPAILTAWQDDTVGATIVGSTNNPQTSANIALLLFNTGSVDLKHLRIAYASEALEFDGAEGTVSHCQFVKCGVGAATLGGDLRLRNDLFYRCSWGLVGVVANIYGEHLTVNQSELLLYEDGPSQLRLTNTLLVAVTNLGTTNYNAPNENFIWLTNDPGVFQTVGAAIHYLPENSPYRKAGSTNIPPSLLSEIRLRTTHAPTVIGTNGSITNDLVLPPQFAGLPTDLPDLGYHYPTLDYVLGNARIDGAALTLTNGVAVGIYSTIWSFAACVLECGATLNSQGTPVKPNHIVSYNAVQEQATTNWTGSGGSLDLFGFDNYGCDRVGLNCRFTRFSRPAGFWQHIGVGDVGWMADFSFRDCEFYSGGVYFTGQGVTATEFNAEAVNCLFHRSYLECFGMDQDYYTTVRNSLFYGGSFSILDGAGGIFSLTVKDNLFDESSISQNTTNLVLGYNAYWNCSTNLIPTATGNVFLTNAIAYQVGALGEFYQPTNSPLLNAGSVTNAGLVGLYHFTTVTNQIKETNSPVDIGFHYVACDANGEPQGGDDDGLPDYFEDTNGNGSQNGSETDPTDPDSDNDGISDYVEWLQGGNAMASGRVADTNNVINLRVYTPLK